MRVPAFTFRGLRVPVEVRGDGDDELIFFPGLGVRPGYYRDGLERLGSSFTVFTPDLSFPTHRKLFCSVTEYRAFARAMGERFAPEALWSGHSFGGLLALLGHRPAIALAPTVPVNAGWIGLVGRLLRLQLREYAGKEGLRGVRWAWRIMLDYVAAALARPRSLFPVAADLLDGPDGRFTPSAPRAHVLLARGDALYRDDEYGRYLSGKGESYRVEKLPVGHDWPVTEPDLLARTIREATRALKGSRKEARRDRPPPG